MYVQMFDIVFFFLTVYNTCHLVWTFLLDWYLLWTDIMCSKTHMWACPETHHWTLSTDARLHRLDISTLPQKVFNKISRHNFLFWLPFFPPTVFSCLTVSFAFLLSPMSIIIIITETHSFPTTACKLLPKARPQSSLISLCQIIHCAIHYSHMQGVSPWYRME